MTKLKQQLQDWQKLKGLCDKLKGSEGVARKEVLEKFYGEVKAYYQTHKLKFDYHHPPK